MDPWIKVMLAWLILSACCAPILGAMIATPDDDE